MNHSVTNTASIRTSESGSSSTSSVRRVAGTGSWHLALLTVLACLPALTVQAAVDDVEVDQSPLIVSDPLPPNIVLIHDDSGSMGRNYLPDTAPKYGEDFRKYSENQQYYNPGTLYTIPPQADGSSYSTPVFPQGYEDPFDGTDTDNILLENRYSDSGNMADPSYTTRNACKAAGGSWAWNGWGGYYYCSVYSRAFVFYDGGDKHHVIEDGENCYSLSNCHHASDTLTISGKTTTYGQNVANFYSYYRTRELAAKSGIMSAFTDLNPAYRFGFGSLNNSNKNALGANVFSKHMNIRHVAPFGEGNDASSTKTTFWSWLEDVGANGGTPLRKALETAGVYYQQAQPWQDKDNAGRTVEYSCRPSYTIMVSDGYWSGDAPSDANLKGSDNTTLANGNYTAVAPFVGGDADGPSATLADVANYFWKTDLRPASENNVPETPNDPATWQHMTTFTVGLGLSVDGLGATPEQLFKWARMGDSHKVTGWGGWPTPGRAGGSGKSENVSDMLHAAINGHGGFFSARDPQQFATGLRQALADIASVPGAGSTPTLSSSESLTASTRQYRTSYMTGAWTGDLTSAAYDDAVGTFTANPWSAAAQLPAASNRNIWTIDKNGTAVEFKQDKLGDYLKVLGDNLYDGDPKGEDWGKHIVNYLRGDQRYEDDSTTPITDTLRKRDSLLGDIVSGVPVVIGAPDPDLFNQVKNDSYFEGLNGASSYEKFANASASRASLVYVAANDGMLHAFNADTGKEVFAYIPGAVVGGTGDASLARLANPEYGAYNPVDGSQPVPHQYFNDGRLTTQNVYLGGEWKTILVGTTGRGTSRTVYALDITNPADLADPAKAKNAILWERSAGDGKSNADWIGMALGRPTISLIDAGGKGKWVVHLGNGPNSEKNKAALLQFELATGALNVYTAGSMTDNGLAAPYVIQKDNSDGVSEYAFAGDLQGNVWRFDLSSTGGSVTSPIFVAKDDAGRRQPIMADMLATLNEDTGAVWVFFGTGRFLTDSDIRGATPQVQTWYGLRALQGPSNLAQVSGSDTRNELQEREILAEKTENSGLFRATSLGDASDLTIDDNVGWYMDLESPVNGQEGERIVYQTQVIAGRLIVNTLIPKSNSPCDTFPAGATLIVDPFSGANPGEGVLDTNGDDDIDDNDATTISGKKHHYNGQRYNVGLAGIVSALWDDAGNVQLFGLGLDSSELGSKTTGSRGDAERLNWQEIYN